MRIMPPPRHKLFHALAAGARIVIAVSLQKIYSAPHTQASTQGNHQRFEKINRRVKKFHKYLHIISKI